MGNGVVVLFFVIEQISQIIVGKRCVGKASDGTFQNEDFFDPVGETVIGICLFSFLEGTESLCILIKLCINIALIVVYQRRFFRRRIQDGQGIGVKSGTDLIKGELQIIMGFLSHGSLPGFQVSFRRKGVRGFL